MKKVTLEKSNLFAIVDDDDFESVSKFKWRPHNSRGYVYAVRATYINKKYTLILMHRFIMKSKKGTVVDHKDHNCLNNVKNNLRVCSISQNSQNQLPQKKIKHSRYKGVGTHKASGKIRAYIKINQKSIHIGYFNSEIEAAKAYNRKAKELFGDYALLNDVDL